MGYLGYIRVSRKDGREGESFQSPDEQRRRIEGWAQSRGFEVRARIIYEHGQGETITAIARRLNAEGVPTAQGGAKWWAGTVRKLVLS